LIEGETGVGKELIAMPLRTFVTEWK